MASIAATLGVIGAAVFGIAYSRKANVAVSAEVHRTSQGVYLAARPAVSAVGPFKLQFDNSEPPTVTLTEIVQTPEGSDFGKVEVRPAFPDDQLINPGETLTSSVLFNADSDTPNLVGWKVGIQIKSADRMRRGLHWADRVFVPATD